MLCQEDTGPYRVTLDGDAVFLVGALRLRPGWKPDAADGSRRSHSAPTMLTWSAGGGVNRQDLAGQGTIFV